MSLPIVRQRGSGQPIGRVTPAHGLWDTEAVAAGSTTNVVNLFANVLGQADASALISRKGLGSTNLEQARQLPNAFKFEIHYITLKFVSNSTTYGLQWTDIQKIMNGSYYELKISDIVVARELLWSMPFGVHPEFDGNTTADLRLVWRVGVGHRSNGLVTKMKKANPTIGPTELFSAAVYFNQDGTSTGINPSVDFRVINELYGLRYQPL
jgi:hypothetical protein